MFLMASHYLNLEQQDLVVVISWLYLTSSLSNALTDMIVSPLLYFSPCFSNLMNSLPLYMDYPVGILL